ncbi:MAG: protein kinase [Nannocystaceae bacterium]
MDAEPETRVLPVDDAASTTGSEARLRRRIGRYEILQRLGHGGMATVFLGRATGSAGFEKLVAIKVIHPHLAAEPDLVDMFLDEARIAARIHSPHVVEILDLGHDQGDYYMVMEFVDGETLSALLRALRPSGRLPLPAILQIMADACEGLRAAHDLRDADGHLFGVIHRDVSPQNLLIDLSGWVKIVDFGIMKAKGKRSDTRTGQLRGKFPYMSPEQAQAKPLTPACDLFALGVILWELCTGQRLFAGETDVETLSKVIACERPPLAEVRSDLPEGLERVLSRTLARDPADRYPSASAMLVELRALQREHAGEVDARAQLAALMRSTFGGQVDYRRATLRTPRPSIALVPSMGEEDATRPDGAAPREVTTRRGAPALSVVPPADEALESGSGGHSQVLTTPLPGQAASRPVSGSQAALPQTTRAWALWFALPLVGAAIAILTLVASGVLGRTPESALTPRPAIVPEGERAAAIAPPAAPTAQTIRWIINSDPVGASVAIKGASPEEQAAIDAQLADKVTPLEVSLPRGEESALTLEVSLAGYLGSTERRLPLETENLRYVLRPIPEPEPGDERRPAGKKSLRFTARTKSPTKTEPTATEEPLPTEPNFDKPLKRRTPEGG